MDTTFFTQTSQILVVLPIYRQELIPLMSALTSVHAGTAETMARQDGEQLAKMPSQPSIMVDDITNYKEFFPMVVHEEEDLSR